VGNSAAETLETLQEHEIPEECFLLDLVCYAKLRLPTLNRYCVVSDEPHLFEPMLIPTVSCRDAALFTYNNLDGWWRQAAEDIADEVEVVDLLLAIAKAAFLSPRWEQLLGIDADGPNHPSRELLFPTLLHEGSVVMSPAAPDIAKARGCKGTAHC